MQTLVHVTFRVTFYPLNVTLHTCKQSNSSEPQNESNLHPSKSALTFLPGSLLSISSRQPNHKFNKAPAPATTTAAPIAACLGTAAPVNATGPPVAVPLKGLTPLEIPLAADEDGRAEGLGEVGTTNPVDATVALEVGLVVRPEEAVTEPGREERTDELLLLLLPAVTVTTTVTAEVGHVGQV